MTAVLSVVTVRVGVLQGERIRPIEVSATFDPIRTQDQARGAGRQLGEALAEVLALRLQHGDTLA